MEVQPEIDLDLDPSFEPQTRARSNTWPLRPREVSDTQSSPASDESTSEQHRGENNVVLNKKTTSRRNAWGNMSYADLITKAIQSSHDHRLTLSQIYDWMVQNVPYFKDKGDSTSSAGWKNSIRHNLSLHSRFMRIQNEGTGKSSWWVINPDAKPGKSPRRRAGSMETKSYEKKRGRFKKKVELENSPSSTTEDYIADSLGFQLSPDFRPRASSNASSCGRLSPIQAAIEPNLDDNQVPPMSPIPWGVETDTDSENMNYSNSGSDGFADKLVDTLVGSMKLAESGGLGLRGATDIDMLGDVQAPLMARNTNGLELSQYGDNNSSFSDTQYSSLNASPVYSDQRPQLTNLERLTLPNMAHVNIGQSNNMVFSSQDPLYCQDPLISQNSMLSQTRVSPVSSQLNIQSSPSHSPSGNQRSPSNYNSRGFKPINPPHTKSMVTSQQQNAQQSSQARSLLQQCLEAPSDSLLRAALTQKSVQYQMANASPTTMAQQYNQYMAYQNAGIAFPTSGNGTVNTNIINGSLSTGGMVRSLPNNNVPNLTPSIGPMPSQGVHFPVSSNQSSSNSLTDVNFDPDFIEDIQCDVQEILEHELRLDGNLDFNFEPMNSSATSNDNQNLVR
ncbi:hypothetical protein ScPMuIL_013399 [Solemya velum]